MNPHLLKWLPASEVIARTEEAIASMQVVNAAWKAEQAAKAAAVSSPKPVAATVAAWPTPARTRSWRLAAHEAAHLCVAHRLWGGSCLHSATIDGQPEALIKDPEDATFFERVVVSASGPAAEMIFHVNDPFAGDRIIDMHSERDSASVLIGQDISPELWHEAIETARRLIDQCGETVEVVASALMRHGRLDRQALVAILGG